MNSMDIDWLDVLFWASLLVSMFLGAISLMAIGKHVADLQYQTARNLNGIRWIQSWMNLRIHNNRVLFAVAFSVTSILGLIDLTIMHRVWVSRSLFFVVLITFTISAILDWLAESKQLAILKHYEETNHIPKLRINMHALNGKLTELYGYVELGSKQHQFEIASTQDDIKRIIADVQHDLHEMDVSYPQKPHAREITREHELVVQRGEHNV